MDELTNSHFEIAASHGISRKNVLQRYWDYGWDLHRAITEPVLKRDSSVWYQWKETCRENGVDNVRFSERIRKQGMTPEQAATTPVKKYKKAGS